MEGQERDHNASSADNQTSNTASTESRAQSCGETPISFATCHANDDGQARTITRDSSNITREMVGNSSNTQTYADGRCQNLDIGSTTSESSIPRRGRGDRIGPAQRISRRYTIHLPSNVQRTPITPERILLPARRFSQPMRPLRSMDICLPRGVPYDPVVPRHQANQERRFWSRRIRMEYELLRGELGITFPSPIVMAWVREDASRDLGLEWSDTDSEREIDPAYR